MLHASQSTDTYSDTTKQLQWKNNNSDSTDYIKYNFTNKELNIAEQINCIAC